MACAPTSVPRSSAQGVSSTVQASGSARRDLLLDVPAWTRGIQVDVQMPRTEWGRFTDLGLSALRQRRSPAGQGAGQLFVRPAGARTGERTRGAAGDGVALPRLRAAGRRGTVDDQPSPSASMPTRRRRWCPADERALTLGPGETRTMRFSAASGLRSIPTGYVPLGLLLVRTGDDEIWATEALLSPASRRRRQVSDVLLERAAGRGPDAHAQPPRQAQRAQRRHGGGAALGARRRGPRPGGAGGGDPGCREGFLRRGGPGGTAGIGRSRAGRERA